MKTILDIIPDMKKQKADYPGFCTWLSGHNDPTVKYHVVLDVHPITGEAPNGCFCGKMVVTKYKGSGNADS
jgi:hypothetical protein